VAIECELIGSFKLGLGDRELQPRQIVAIETDYCVVAHLLYASYARRFQIVQVRILQGVCC
jgi:hypothetical protein